MQEQPNPTTTPPQSPSALPPVEPPPGPRQPKGEHVFYNAANDTSQAAAPGHTAAALPETVTWEASEYVHNSKGGLWILGFLVIVALLVGLAIWLGAWTFVALILVMAAAMAVFAFRPPHVLRYTITGEGIHIGDKVFLFSDYRAFGVLQDGAFFTMTMIPVKRFSPALSVYFAQDQGEQIVDIVGEHLPMEDIQPDMIDTLMRRLRF